MVRLINESNKGYLDTLNTLLDKCDNKSRELWRSYRLYDEYGGYPPRGSQISFKSGSSTFIIKFNSSGNIYKVYDKADPSNDLYKTYDNNLKLTISEILQGTSEESVGNEQKVVKDLYVGPFQYGARTYPTNRMDAAKKLKYYRHADSNDRYWVYFVEESWAHHDFDIFTYPTEDEAVHEAKSLVNNKLDEYKGYLQKNIDLDDINTGMGFPRVWVRVIDTENLVVVFDDEMSSKEFKKLVRGN